MSKYIKYVALVLAFIAVGAYLPTMDYFTRVAKGDISGSSVDTKFGANSAVGTSEELISQTGTTLPYMPVVAMAIEAVSTDADDASAGTGAGSVVVFGLNSSWVEDSSLIPMNGVTPATPATAKTYYRIYRAYVQDVGAYSTTNQGTISIRTATTDTNFVQITANKGQTQTTHYCVPSGYTLYLYDMHIFADPTKNTTIRLYRRNSADDITVPFRANRLVSEHALMNSPLDIDYKNAPKKFSAKTDLWITGQTSTGSAEISAEYTFNLIAD
jgi:hypothetical protein